MARITVVVGEPPYGKERLYTTLRFVLMALTEGHRVNLFLFEDAVYAAKKGQVPPDMPALLDARMPSCEELLKAAVKQGAQVRLCGVCSAARGLPQEEVLEGVMIGGMKDLVDWVATSDKVMSF